MVESVQVEFLPEFDTVKLFWPKSDKLNRELFNLVLKKQKEDPQGKKITNRGGWHSKQEVLNWKNSCVEALVTRIHAARNEMERCLGPPDHKLKLDMAWANVNRKGNLNYPHWHNAYWCGFYCVSSGDHSSGDTCLVKSLEGENLQKLPWNMMTPPKGVEKTVKHYSHPATEGSLLIFPGSLLHYVNPYYGDGTRITIAFNFVEEEV